MPSPSRVVSSPSPERVARLERVRELLEFRRNPSRRVGIFSATNLTRLVLRFGAMGAAAAVVQRLLGGTVFQVPAAAFAIGVADHYTDRLWRRIREQVRKTWNVVGLVGAAVLVLVVVVGQAAPDAALTRGVRGWFGGFVERQNAAIDARMRAKRTPVDSAAATDQHWVLLTDSGFVRRGTFAEAREWCAALGPGWELPAGLGALPDLARWPDVGTLFYVWTMGGTGLQVGDGQKPGVGVSGATRPTETRAVLCLRQGA
ncbi:MAG: hypothetical protein U0104_01720 [Gemmatimonadales bacterium]